MRAIRILCLVAVVLLAALPAGATPVCPDEPRTVCGGRIFPEATNTTGFVQHDGGEYLSGIEALERDYPRFVRVRSFTQVLGHEAKSVGGRDMWLVEITDFDAPEKNKLPVVASLSVHGPERAGLEGGVRYMEDLARWLKDEPDHELRNGTEKDSTSIAVSDAMKRVHLYLADINPDGWSDGDNGGAYTRGNADGIDLNREFPTTGYTRVSYTALSEPESKAWNELVQTIDPVVTTDIHGELTSEQNAFADMMYPAGKWNPVKQAQEERLARHMKSNVARYFEQEGVEAGQISGNAGMKPAEYATGYDVVGYDASGFMGDWFTQEFDAIDMDVEHFLSHMVPNSTWFAPLEEAHIAAVRGEIETLIVEALVTDDVRVRLNLGRVGYIYDPHIVTNKDGYGGPKPPKKVRPQSYRATRMQYFKALGRFTTRPLSRVSLARLSSRKLRRLDTFIVSDQKVPRKAVKILEKWTRAGGNLILTDKALKVLGALSLVENNAVQKHLYVAGHIDIDDFEDPYTKDVHTTASQTYYEVPLGYSADEDSSPHWTVNERAWTDANGVKIAHIEDEAQVGLGRAEFGKGTIGIIGALLPQPTEKFDHFYGLSGYAVTVAGGQILNNMISFGR